ncbi:Arc family DNA-binding protein [Pseudomonas fluorescens]|uniref:Arc family DNA-binding protein n=1 Tax=Pseudomonas fluorescens TaxID=294 RepID=UPI0024B55818|nr:Arc family DNA-binding protein [Pseudomonas fluorescens]
MPNNVKPTLMPSYNSRAADKFVVRMPEGLRDRINEAAEKNHRSMNGEIVARISGSLDLERRYEEMRQLNSFLNQKISILETAQLKGMPDVASR